MTTKVMVLIDGDNVTDDDVVEQALERIVALHGAAHVRRMYCTAKMAADRAKLLKKLSIRPIVNVSAGKNSTDIALAVDAIDLALAERPAVAAIVSSDADFSSLVIRLREKGCRVEGYGQDHKAGDDIRAVYDHFEAVARRKARAAKAPAARKAAKAAPVPVPPRAPEPWEAILDALPQLRSGDWLPINAAADPLRKAKLLSKSASSPKLFGKFPDQFALEPKTKPTKVRFLGAA